MLTNIAAVQMTPDAPIAAKTASPGVGVRSDVPLRLDLVVETIWQHPTEARDPAKR